MENVYNLAGGGKMPMPKEISRDELLRRLKLAEIYEMDDILHAVRNRYKELHPDTDFVLVSIPQNNPKERTALWEWLVAYVRKNEICEE